MPSTQRQLPVAVLASGRGSNLAALIEARDAGRLPVDLRLVASDRVDAQALRRAEAAGVPTVALAPSGYPTRRDYDLDLMRRVADSGAELLVLAGFMRILDADAVAPWHGRIINVHPSLLPKYPGLHTHRRALEAGDTVHGASVHFVTAQLDGGPVIAQTRLPVHPGDTADTLAERLLPREHRMLTAVVEAIARGRLDLRGDGVHFDGHRLDAPLTCSDDGTLTAA